MASVSVSIIPGGAHVVSRSAGGVPAGVTFESLPTYKSGSYFAEHPTFFPLQNWLVGVESSSELESDTDVGFNQYTGLWCPASLLTTVAAAGVRMALQHNEWGQAAAPNHEGSDYFSTAGVADRDMWFIIDEPDMNLGGTNAEKIAYMQSIHTYLSGVGDGTICYHNYGKGVLFWEAESAAAEFVNEFPDVVMSADAYWYTDPNIHIASEGGHFITGESSDLSDEQTRRAANYGNVIDKMITLDAVDDPAPRHPMWCWIEVGRPFSETIAQGQPTITANQIRGAAWHSVIAGAQGIGWFNTSFSADGGYNQTWVCTRDSTYAAQTAAVTEVNARITALSAVILSDTAVGYVSSPYARTLAKYHEGSWYLFAGIDGSAAAGSHTFTVAAGSTVEVLYESRTLSVVGGEFTDSFAAEYSTHIYRVT